MTRLLATLGSKIFGSNTPRPHHPVSNKRRRKLLTATATATATAIASASAVLVTGAILYPGFKTTEVELNDGGVWVVSKSKNAVGRPA